MPRAAVRGCVLLALACRAESAGDGAPSAPSPEAVVVLRGDSFRFGINGQSGCVAATQAIANQLHQLRSIDRFVAAPLVRLDLKVRVGGLLYNCSLNGRVRAHFERSDLYAKPVRVIEEARGRPKAQRITTARALAGALESWPRAELFVVSRLDVTYAWSLFPPPESAGARERRPACARATSLCVPWLVGESSQPPDQVFAIGRSVVDEVIRVLVRFSDPCPVRDRRACMRNLTDPGPTEARPAHYVSDMQRHFQAPLEEQGLKVDGLFQFGGVGSCQQRETTWESAPFTDCARCVSPACLPDSTLCGTSWHEHEWRPAFVARYCEFTMKRYISKGMGVASSGLDEHTKRVALTNFTSPPGPWAVATLNSREERNARSRERHLRDAEVSESRSRSAL